MIEWGQLLLRFDEPLGEDIESFVEGLSSPFRVGISVLSGVGAIKGYAISHDRRTITFDIDFSDLALPEGHPFV